MSWGNSLNCPYDTKSGDMKMNYIKVEEGLYLREDLIGAVQIISNPDTNMFALKYYSTSGNEFMTNWTRDIKSLMVSLPMNIREDLEKRR